MVILAVTVLLIFLGGAYLLRLWLQHRWAATTTEAATTAEMVAAATAAATLAAKAAAANAAANGVPPAGNN